MYAALLLEAIIREAFAITIIFVGQERAVHCELHPAGARVCLQVGFLLCFGKPGFSRNDIEVRPDLEKRVVQHACAHGRVALQDRLGI